MSATAKTTNHDLEERKIPHLDPKDIHMSNLH
jgi:hypothetical protein